MKRARRLSRAGVAVASLSLAAVTAGTAAYAVTRRSSAAADAGTAVPAAVALDAKLAAARVTYGSAVRVSGDIRDAAGRPLAYQPVEVLAVPVADRSAVSVVAAATSDAHGRVRTSFRAGEGSDVWLRFVGAPGLAEATSPAVHVAVAPRVTVAARTVTTRGGWTTTLSGTVRPGRAGDRLRLDRRVGGAWRPIARARLTARHTYAFTVRTTAPGTDAYRVTRPADAAFAAGTATRSVKIAPRPPRLPRGNGTGGTGRLLVAGDSFAFWLGQQLGKLRAPLVTTIESRHSSGLSRPDFFDWTGFARRQARAPLGGVVLFLGANDCQPIQLAGSRRYVNVGTDAWVGEYRRRAVELIRTFGSGGRPVYWVGLPIVRKADIAACYRAINTATAGAARATGTVWVDTWSVYAVDGRYSPVVAGIKARQDDGIHLTYEGTRLLTRKVFALLR